MDSKVFAIALSPDGKLFVDFQSPDESIWESPYADVVSQKFAEGQGKGLLALGFLPSEQSLPVSVRFWRSFSERFLYAVRQVEGLEEKRSTIEIPFPTDLNEEFLASAPPMRGGEYLRPGFLFEFWLALRDAFRDDLNGWKGTVKEYFFSRNPAWRLVERVCFNLAENRKNPRFPFAFLATYTSGMGPGGVPKHLPLKQSLEEYAGARNRMKLLELLKPLDEAGEKSPFLKQLVESKQVYYPLGWTPPEAYNFLRDIPAYEEAGIMCRVPDWWKARAKSRPFVQAKIGGKTDGYLCVDNLMSFSVEVVLGEQAISPEEWNEIRAKNEGLALIRGQWVELDSAKLEQVLLHWKKVEKAVGRDGINFIESMRLLAGASKTLGDAVDEEVSAWSRIVAGETLRETLECLRKPESIHSLLPGDEIKGTLRPYQQTGVRWLGFLDKLGLGPCLADDMGLGKTLQVLAFLAIKKREKDPRKPSLPSLLVVPASLMGNWETEIHRFTPDLNFTIAHPSIQKELAKSVSESESLADLPYPEESTRSVHIGRK